MSGLPVTVHVGTGTRVELPRPPAVMLLGDRGPQSLRGRLGPAFCRQSGLEVLGVNSRFSTLLPGHLRSLRPVHLNELGLRGASG